MCETRQAFSDLELKRFVCLFYLRISLKNAFATVQFMFRQEQVIITSVAAFVCPLFLVQRTEGLDYFS